MNLSYHKIDVHFASMDFSKSCSHFEPVSKSEGLESFHSSTSTSILGICIRKYYIYIQH